MKKRLYYFFGLLLLLNNTFAQESIQHVEPLNWWVGMKNPRLQLLIHGKNIASFTPSIQYKGVSILKVNKVTNPNYLFIDLLITPQAKAGDMKIVLSNLKMFLMPKHLNFTTKLSRNK